MNQLTKAKWSIIFLLLFELLFFCQVWMEGWVIYPHDNSYEVGITAEADDYSNNRKFSDESRSYIPNLYQHLNLKRVQSIAGIDPSVQLGKPLGQLGALSRAYVVINVISALTTDPLKVFTIYIVFIIALGAVFLWAFLRSHHVSESLAVAGGLMFANGIFLTYWQVFPMTVSLFVWSLGIMVSCRLALQTMGPIWPSILAFCVYSLFMTAGPQGIILLGFLIIPYALRELVRVGVRINTCAILFLPAILGALAALPVYVDLWLIAERSSRKVVDFADYAAILPNVTTLSGVTRELTKLFDVFLLKEPTAESLPPDFNGHCFLPVILIMFILSFFYLRGFWIFKCYALFCLLGTFSQSAYAWYFSYLGFSLSRCMTLGGLVIVAPILAILLLERHRQKPLSLIPVILLYAIMISCSFGAQEAMPWHFLIANICLFCPFLLYLRTMQVNFLLVCVVLQILWYRGYISLLRPEQSIRLDSPLVQSLRKATADGKYRYAKIAMPRDLLSSNQEGLLGLRSIHSSDSLSSQEYQMLIASLSSARVGYYGRTSASLAKDAQIASEDFGYLGVSALVSTVPVASNHFYLREIIDGIYVYQSKTWPKLVFGFSGSDREGAMIHRKADPGYGLQRRFADQILIDLPENNQSKFVMVSEQWHPSWEARDQNGQLLADLKLKGFYLGAHLKPSTRQVIFEYKSPARWALLSQLVIGLFVGVAGIIGFYRARLHKRKPAVVIAGH